MIVLRLLIYKGTEKFISETLERSIQGTYVAPNGGSIRSIIISPNLLDFIEGNEGELATYEKKEDRSNAT